MNQWAEKVGCEVNVCQARFCDSRRAEDCALRAAYNDRVAVLKVRVKQLRNVPELRAVVIDQLRKMGVDYDESKV